ncbi:MAG: phosphoribosylanthranilate isomerase [Candidatus Omnitrophota bacterium]
MVKIKICGITNLRDALASVEAGCDALGFVFYKKSPRYIDPEEARDIIKALAKSIIRIGVFVNSDEQTIKRIAKTCGLKMLQFHGNESPEFCARFKGYKIIKSFRIKNKIDLKSILKYKIFAFLFDTYMPSKPGGTGKAFNWKLVRHVDGLKRPVFLSGGLNKNNVRKAIEIAEPDWVDASSCLEKSPGKKDIKKVREFIKAVKII